MKKLILILSAAFLLSMSQSSNVYICTGGSSVAYHKTKTCKGLTKCGKEIQSITLAKAKELGRRECKICYKTN